MHFGDYWPVVALLTTDSVVRVHTYNEEITLALSSLQVHQMHVVEKIKAARGEPNDGTWLAVDEIHAEYVNIVQLLKVDNHGVGQM